MYLCVLQFEYYVMVLRAGHTGVEGVSSEINVRATDRLLGVHWYECTKDEISNSKQQYEQQYYLDLHEERRRVKLIPMTLREPCIYMYVYIPICTFVKPSGFDLIFPRGTGITCICQGPLI